MKLLALQAALAALIVGQQMLPTGWRIQPAGKQITVGALPTSSALSPDGRYLAVVSDNTVSVIRASDATLLANTTAPGAWKGVVFSLDGKFVYVGAGPRNRIYEYAIDDAGALTLSKEMTVDGFTSDIAIPPGGRLLYTTDLLGDRVILVNPQNGSIVGRARSGRRPYQIVFHPDGRSYYVSAMGDAAVIHYDSDRGSELSRHRVGPSPAGMVLSNRRVPETEGIELRLFVAAANTNNVYTIHIDRNKTMRTGDTLNIGFAPTIPAGMTPTALALSRDQTRLYVTCSGVNAVAVADISEERARLAAFIPASAYPADVRALNDDRLAVVNHGLATVSWIDPEPLVQRTETALGLVAYSGELYEEAGAALSGVLKNVVLIRSTAAPGPNAEKLSREFAAVRNFRLNWSAVEGVSWTTAGQPTHFARLIGTKITPAQLETDPANLPPAGTLGSNAKAAGLAADSFTLVQDIGTDAALGERIAAISRSPAWPRTVIFIEQANGPLLVVSPYSRGVQVPASGFFNQSSLLRTMELILKLRPMTLFDGAAPPIIAAFSAAPNPEPYVPAP